MSKKTSYDDKKFYAKRLSWQKKVLKAERKANKAFAKYNQANNEANHIKWLADQWEEKNMLWK